MKILEFDQFSNENLQTLRCTSFDLDPQDNSRYLRQRDVQIPGTYENYILAISNSGELLAGEFGFYSLQRNDPFLIKNYHPAAIKVEQLDASPIWEPVFVFNNEMVVEKNEIEAPRSIVQLLGCQYVTKDICVRNIRSKEFQYSIESPPDCYYQSFAIDEDRSRLYCQLSNATVEIHNWDDCELEKTIPIKTPAEIAASQPGIIKRIEVQC